jgi:hypothetical protein
MGTYYFGSGSAAGDLGFVATLGTSWMEILSAQYVGENAVTPLPGMRRGVTLDLAYDVPAVRLGTRHQGKRGQGGAFPAAPERQWKTVRVHPLSRGIREALDGDDGYRWADPMAAAMEGTDGYRQSFFDLRTLIHDDIVTLLTQGSTPFDTADQAASAGWATTSTNWTADITAAKQAHETTRGYRLPLNHMVISTHTQDAMAASLAVAAGYAGNQGLGPWSQALLNEALQKLGVTRVTVVPDVDFGGWVVLMHDPGTVLTLTPNGNRIAGPASAVVLAHAEQSLAMIHEPEKVPGTGGLRWEYLVSGHWDLAVLPELGVRISGAT